MAHVEILSDGQALLSCIYFPLRQRCFQRYIVLGRVSRGEDMSGRPLNESGEIPCGPQEVRKRHPFVPRSDWVRRASPAILPIQRAQQRGL